MKYGLTLLALVTIWPSELAAQGPLRLNVHVREQGTARPVRSATVEVLGVVRSMSDERGNVQLDVEPIGSHTIVVSALGFETSLRRVILAGDTSIVVDLAIAAIPLDPVVGTQRSIRLIGEVAARDSRSVIPGADVVVGEQVTRTDGVGIFVARKLLPNDSVLVEVRAIGYLPTSQYVEASRDTVIKLYLEPDPVGQAMVRAQLKRLDQAVQHLPTSVRRLTRDDMLRDAGSVLDILKYHGVSRVRCLVVDGRQITVGLQYLNTVAREEVERVEIIAGSTVRVYTYEYVRRQLPRLEVVPRMVSGVCM